MELTPEQKQKVTAWISDGLKLSEIQRRLAEEYALHLTYMEARLLIDDLRLTPKDNAAREVPAEIGKSAKPPGADPTPAPSFAEPDEEASAASGRLAVQTDSIARPGTIVSGNVTFSDGKKARWYLDQLGRLGMVPEEQGYRPPPADMADFQVALERELVRLGI